MNLSDYVSSGGTSIWQLAPRGTASTHLWALDNVFTVNQYFNQMCWNVWKGAAVLVVGMFFAEAARLYLGNKIGESWKGLLFRLLLVLTMISLYPVVVWAPAEMADAVMQGIADDASCNEALFTFMTTAEKSMLATFNPTGATGTTIENQTNENILQGISYTLFYLVWWILPIAIAGALMGTYIIGPYCLAFFLFKPTAGVAGMWAKFMGGGFLAYVMLCIAFHLLLASQVFLATATTNSISDPFSTIAFSLAGLLVAFSMPGFAVRILGGRLSFFPGKQ